MPKLYFGNDTYGRAVQAAVNDDGVWFSREYGYNGYGMGWSKWRPLNDVLKPVTEVRNAYTDEVFQVPVEEQHKRVWWGFQKLNLMEGARVRLPA